jgi:hypothetical protein
MPEPQVAMKFYKFRYWLLDTVGTGLLTEEDKNTRFVSSFFNNQEIQLGGDVYKIKVIHKDVNTVFGQIGRISRINLNVDKGPLIEKESTDDTPFLYYFANVETNVQIIYIEYNYTNIVGTTCPGIESKLGQIASQAVQPMHARFSCIVAETDFWIVVSRFSIIKAVEFKLIRPNFLHSSDSIQEVLDELNISMRNEELKLGYQNEDGLLVSEDNESLKNQAQYASEYSGSWAISGKKTSESHLERITKYKRFKHTVIILPKSVKENCKELLKFLQDQFTKDI